MLIEIGQKAKETSYILGKMGTDLKNAGLLAAAQEILDEEDEILKANAADVAKAKERGMAPGLVDRLELNHKRIEGIVEGMRQVVGLEDPVGEVISMKRRPNGLFDRPETGALRCYRNHLRGETERYGRCFCALL